jgi:hypothetical protein
MHEQAILEIDQAAMALIKALEAHQEEMGRYIDSQQIESLEGELINLRRMLLALEMGVLYQNWEPPADVLESVAYTAHDESIPVNEAAVKLAQLVQQKKKGTE